MPGHLTILDGYDTNGEARNMKIKNTVYQIHIFDAWDRTVESFRNEEDAKERAKYYATLYGTAKIVKHTEIDEVLGRFVRKEVD